MNDAEVSKINAAIRKACWDIMPYNAIREDAEGGTQVIADIIQDVWVRTLEKGDIGGRAFAIETKNVIRDWMRRELPMMPVSQMTLQPADAEDEDSELLMPWDRVVAGSSVCQEQVDKINTRDWIEKLSNVHDAMKGLKQADRRFLLGYLSKKQAHTPAQKMRFQRLVNKMRKKGEEKTLPF